MENASNLSKNSLNTYSNILITGMGSPILRDHSLGFWVIDKAKKILNDHPGITFREVLTGGLDMLYELSGFTKAVIVNCCTDLLLKPGQTLEYLYSSNNNHDSENAICRLTDSHGIDLRAVVDMGKLCGYKMPDPIMIYAIGAGDLHTFDEHPTEPVAAAINGIVDRILNCVAGWEQTDSKE